MKYEPVIGLEVHVQLNTRTKLFCGCPNRFGDPPNTNICPVCTGQPGVLPVLNRAALEKIVRLGLATGCRIAPRSVFARKNYFYPDLPKNYQISQYELPICSDGKMEIETDGAGKEVKIIRIHLEEDAGKLLHAIGSEALPFTLVDFNRCGSPLAEIVSGPDLSSPEEAHAYLTALRRLVRAIAVSEADMEKGEFRCDANISLRPAGAPGLGVKVEVKNMNSFKAVRDALSFEVSRQSRLLDAGERVVQETRLWNQASGRTEPMRSKEEAHDYRYFPEPDLVPLSLSREWVEGIRRGLPELPAARRKRYMEEYGLKPYDASVLTSEPALSDYFEKTVAAVRSSATHPSFPGGSPPLPSLVCSFITTELLGRLEGMEKIGECKASPERLAELVAMVADGRIGRPAAKQVLDEMLATGEPASRIVEKKGLTRMEEGELEKIVEEVLAENPKAAADVRGGKEAALGALLGAVMRKSSGRADPQKTRALLRQRLSAG